MKVDPGYFGLALSTTRDEFVSRHPLLFLFGIARLTEFGDVSTTRVMHVMSDHTAPLRIPGGAEPISDLEEEPLILAVRKTRQKHTGLISVGRIDLNDIVLCDPLISKLHAHFRIHPDRVELADAGSSNGTFVNERGIGQHSVSVVPGDAIRFAQLAFTLCTAAMCWDRVHGVT